jgi:hypothetical protein
MFGFGTVPAPDGINLSPSQRELHTGDVKRFLAVLGFAACGCFSLTARSVETGRLLAAGPAWAVDVAQYTVAPPPAMAGEITATSDTVYIPTNAHWVTYVIRAGRTTYIAREKTNFSTADVPPDRIVTFKVSGSRLVWKAASGPKHTAHLVVR